MSFSRFLVGKRKKLVLLMPIKDSIRILMLLHRPGQSDRVLLFGTSDSESNF